MKKCKVEPIWINVNYMPVIAEHELKHIAHYGSSFDSWIILNILPACARIIIPIRTARGLTTVKILIGFCDVTGMFQVNHNINI